MLSLSLTLSDICGSDSIFVVDIFFTAEKRAQNVDNFPQVLAQAIQAQPVLLPDLPIVQ